MIINGHELEYYDDEHIYLVDGVIVPSITTLMSVRFGGMYKDVPPEVLAKAAQRGTRVHAEIEQYLKLDIDTESDELNGFKAILKESGYDVKACEVPVILYREEGKPFAAGRCDLVLELEGVLCGADIKTSYRLNKESLEAQLNLYRLAYKQSYGEVWDYLMGIHLRGEKHKAHKIPINERLAYQIMEEYDEQCSIDW